MSITAESGQIEDDLAGALPRDELVLHYQPVVEALGGVAEVEALVRWRHPQLGLLSPGAFLPAAERSGLIGDIDSWSLGAACRQLHAWERAGTPKIGMSVNLSAQDLASRDLPDRFLASLEREDIRPDRMEVEVSSAALDVARGRSALAELRHAGIRVALDDWGGASDGWREIAGMPLDAVKLDRSLASQMPSYLPGLINAAKNDGLTAVAEGVERGDQADQLREWGCDRLQGFGICPPLPADAAQDWLQAG